MKKLFIILTLSAFCQIFGQKKGDLYLDRFDKNEIPEIPVNILIGTSIDEMKQKIYEYRQKSIEIDSLNYTYRIGRKNKAGLWFDSYSSSQYESYDICEQFGSDIYNSKYDYNQNVYYDYNEQNKLLSVSNEYTLKHKEKLYVFSTKTRIDYSVNGKKLVVSKAHLFDEFDAGKWQILDSKGKIINELNFDKKFSLNFIDVFNKLKDFFYFLDLEGDEIILERSFNENEAYWVCKIQTAYCFKAIIINDKSGELSFEDNPDVLEKYLFRDYEFKLIEDFLNVYNN